MTDSPPDDEFDDRDELDPPKYPKNLRTASMIWIIIGVVVPIISLCDLLAGFFIAQSAGAGDKAYEILGGGVCRLFIVFLVGMVFVSVGRTTLSGKAKDTMGNGVGSIILASLGAIGCAAIIFTGTVILKSGKMPEFGMITIGVGILNSIMVILLFAAGVLAIVNRDAYKAWRKWKFPKKPREDQETS
jgi:hypothetical protein